MATATTTASTRGQCLCGAIEFAVTGDPLSSVICHCTNCQKSSGSSFQANWFCKKDQFALVKGESAVSSYRDSATDAGSTILRSFCSVCGSNLFTVNLDNPALKDFIIVTSGCLDEQARKGFAPQREYYCKRRQAWVAPVEASEKFEAMI
ncbi:hypothetical protein RBB50_002896 [Rhinocladiella similis]